MQRIIWCKKETNIDFSAFFEKIGEISDVFNDRFADFDLLRANVELFNNLIEVEEESQPPYSQQVGSVVEWLKHRTDDQHGLGSKPTYAILLCPWERHFTALSPAWWS